MTTKFTREGQQGGHEAPLGVLNERFAVMRPLGHGATSTVFEVKDLQTGEARAMKLLHPDGDEKLMRTEFARLSRLEHPRLVRVHDLDRIQLYDPAGNGEALQFSPGRLFLILDLVMGSDPVDALQGMDHELRADALRLMAKDLAEALSHIHGHGLVHHDVKPDNILLDDNHRLRLIDLGLATWAHQSIAGRGTLAYLAPEALVGGGDFRADLYGIGATLFHLAMGRPPFEGKGTMLIQAILDAHPRLAAPWVGEELTSLIHRLLRKDPLRRPSSARAVLAELARIRGDHHAVAKISGGQELLTPPMVGRKHALAQLTTTFAGLRTGQPPSLVLVLGGPGMGKTRLIQEATREHRIQAAAGRSPPIRFASGDLRELLKGPGQSDAVARWILGGSPGVSEDELALQMADCLSESSVGSKVLHITDLQRDPFTWRVIEVLLQSTTEQGSLLLVVEVSARDAPQLNGDPGRIMRLELPPLTREDVQTLITGIRGQAETAELVERIHGMSQGNPLIATELTRHWHFWGEAGLDLQLVQELDPLLTQSWRCLDSRAIRVLEVMAVWQEGLTAGELSRFLGLEESEIWSDLNDLERRGLIDLEHRQVRLSHPCAPAGLAAHPGREGGSRHREDPGAAPQVGRPAARAGRTGSSAAGLALDRCSGAGRRRGGPRCRSGARRHSGRIWGALFPGACAASGESDAT